MRRLILSQLNTRLHVNACKHARLGLARCEELPDLAPLVSDPSERFDVVRCATTSPAPASRHGRIKLTRLRLSCLNVLDRCDRPMSMLRDMRLLLKPGGVVLLAVVLPFSAIVEDRYMRSLLRFAHERMMQHAAGHAGPDSEHLQRSWTWRAGCTETEPRSKPRCQCSFATCWRPRCATARSLARSLACDAIAPANRVPCTALHPRVCIQSAVLVAGRLLGAVLCAQRRATGAAPAGRGARGVTAPRPCCALAQYRLLYIGDTTMHTLCTLARRAHLLPGCFPGPVGARVGLAAPLHTIGQWRAQRVQHMQRVRTLPKVRALF